MKIKFLILIFLFLLPSVVIASESTKSVSADTVQVLKIAGQDHRAVIKTPDGKMQIINVGDAVGTGAKVTEITGDRVVIEQTKGIEVEKIIFRIESGKQHVERLKKVEDVHPSAFSAKSSPSQDLLTQATLTHEKKPAASKKEKTLEKNKKHKGKKDNKNKKSKNSGNQSNSEQK